MKNYLKDLKDKKFIFSIALLLGGQCLLYNCVKYFQTDYNTFNFSIDSKIPLIPPFIIIYNLFYPFMFCVLYHLFKKDKIEYDKAVIAGVIGYLVCNIIFLSYPVQMIRPDITNINTDWLSKYILNLTYHFDDPAINCFPSIHCLFCFQLIFSIIKSKKLPIRYKLGITFISLTIISSIFFVRQHYVIDMLAALVISIVCNIFIDVLYDIFKKDK